MKWGKISNSPTDPSCFQRCARGLGRIFGRNLIRCILVYFQPKNLAASENTVANCLDFGLKSCPLAFHTDSRTTSKCGTMALAVLPK